MAPKAVSLAYAGRKLTGPPEGYGKKKELQVKRWISGMAHPEDLEQAEVASVVTLTEIDGSREDLYRSLRDSTDGYGPPPPFRPGSKGPGPGLSRPVGPGGQQQAIGSRPTVPAKPDGSPVSGAADHGQSTLPPTSRPTTASSTSLIPAGASAGAAGRAPSLTDSSAALLPPSNIPAFSPVRTSTGRPTQPPSTPSGSGTAAASHHPSATFPPPGGAAFGATLASTADTRRTGPAPPLELDLSAPGGHGVRQDTDLGLAAAIMVARVEAMLPEGVNAEEKYRRALLLAVEEQQRLQDQIRGELAAVRAIAAEARAEAQSRTADVQVAVQRAVQAEEELGRARAEALAHKQQAQALQIELEEGHEGRDEQLARAQAELTAAVAQLKEQSARASRAMETSSAEAASARSAAAALQREMAILRRHHEQDKLKMEALAASLQASLDAGNNAAVALRAERDRAAAALQEEIAARKAAEESERMALRTATKKAETQGALQTTAIAAQAAKQRVAAAAQRAAAVRAADPAAAVVDSSAAAEGAAGVGEGERGSTPRAGAAGSRAGPAARQLAASPASPGPATSGGSPGQAEAATAAARADGHRALTRGLAADRQHLGELVQQHKRAAAAAELADARVVEAALAAAPEHLRTLGLAFRAYLVGSGGQPAAQPAGRGGAAQPGSPAAALAGRLSSAGYRVYVDPLTMQSSPDQLYEVPSAPLVGLSSAVVVLAAPGLLRKPLARGELCSAARHGCLLVVLSPPGLTLEALSAGEEPPLAAGADSAAAQLELALDALRDAWPSRLELAADAASAPAAVATRLGLTDAALALLPLDALRTLAVARTRVMPDLLHLNSPPAGPSGPGSGPAFGSGPGSAGGGGAGGGAGLHHLKLGFQGPAGGGGGPVGPLVELLVSVLQGNSTLTALTLRGCPAAAARTVTEAVLASPVCVVASIAVSSRVPVAHLAGRPTGQGHHPAPAIIDLGPGGGGGHGGGRAVAQQLEELPFTDEDAEVVTAALRARAVAEAADGEGSPQPLVALSLPASCNRRLSPGAVGGLVEALAVLKGLQAVNGVVLQAAAAAARQPAMDSAAGADVGGPAGRGGKGVLDLSGTRCGPVVFALLLRQLQASLATLPALNLTGCEVGPVGAFLLADTAAAASPGGALAALHTACLADNALGLEGIDKVMTAMVGGGTPRGGRASGGSGAASSPPSPSCCAVLDVSLNGLADAGCKALSRSLPGLGPSLRVLALSHNGIGTEGAKALAAALPSCPSLRELLLAGNQLGDQAARELAAALQRLQELQVLHLQDNHRISADGVAGLAGALPSLSRLQELDLSRCHAGNEGARHLGKALSSHPTLASLSLEGCKVRSEGAGLLAAALAPAATPGAAAPVPQPRLTHLGLARNQMGDRGAAAFAEALGRNRTLTSLDLRGNSLGLVGCRGLGAVLRERNNTLRLLALSGNEMEDDVLQALEDLAASHRHVTRPQTIVSPGPAAGPPATTPRARTPGQQQSPGLPPPPPCISGSGGGGGSAAGARTPGGAAAAQQGGSRPPTSSRQQPPQQQQLSSRPAARVGGGGPSTSSAPYTDAYTLEAAEAALAGGVGRGGEDEDLESLLSRYRTKPAHEAATGVSAEGSPNGGLIDLGYTGM